MTTSTARRPLTRKVAGLTWEKRPGLGSELQWQAEHGLYRFVISRQWFLCYVYHLDPAYKAIDPAKDRLSQDCLLNDVHPQGRTLEIIMQDAARLMDYHERIHGEKFHNARNITGAEVKAGMWVHHKGVFYKVVKLFPKQAPYTGWTVCFENRPFPLWFLPETEVTIWEEPTK